MKPLFTHYYMCKNCTNLKYCLKELEKRKQYESDILDLKDYVIKKLDVIETKIKEILGERYG